MADSYAGAVARSNASMKTMWATIGDALKPAMQDLISVFTPIIDGITKFADENPRLTGTAIIVATAIAGITTVLAGVALVLPSIIAGFSVMAGIFGAILSPI